MSNKPCLQAFQGGAETPQVTDRCRPQGRGRPVAVSYQQPDATPADCNPHAAATLEQQQYMHCCWCVSHMCWRECLCVTACCGAYNRKEAAEGWMRKAVLGAAFSASLCTRLGRNTSSPSVCGLDLTNTAGWGCLPQHTPHYAKWHMCRPEDHSDDMPGAGAW
jgi:hypothetical protein